MARTWNACASCNRRLAAAAAHRAAHQAKAGPAWEDFPEGLRRDVDAYFARLTKPRRSFSGRRIRPCKPTTIRTRRAELMAVARMAVRLGVPIESLTSLAALLHPDVVEPVIEAYWQKNGDEPKVFTIDLGWKLLRIARETGGLDQAAIERLDEIRATLEDYRRSGLTPEESAACAPSSDRGSLERGGLTAERPDAAGALGERPRADQGRCHGAACSRNCDPYLCAHSHFQSRRHRVGQEPDQTRRAEHALLARLPAL